MTDKQPEALQYANRDSMALGEYYLRHISAMTSEALHAKSAIAAELAHRDREIDCQHAELETLRAGYEAARLEIESLRARCVEPAGEYPALPEIKDMHNGPQQLNLSDRAMWVLGWNECRDAARDADRAMRTAQPASAAAAAQEPVAVPRFNCWSTNEGDSWFDHPADSQAIYDCLGNNAKVGDEYELTAGWESVTARYRITEVVGDGEEYEVECISHPQENTAPQPSPAAQWDALDTMRLDWLDADDSRCVFHLGKSWYTRPSYGLPYRKRASLREAIDAAIDAARTAQEGK